MTHRIGVRGVILSLTFVAGAAGLIGACSDNSSDTNSCVAGRDGGAGTGGSTAGTGAAGNAGTGGGGNAGSAAGTGAAGTAGADGGADAGDAAVVVNDSQISGVMIEANTGEVHAASIASGRTKTAAVRTFAAMMITDHSMANQSLFTLLDAQGLTASNSLLRQASSDQADMTLNLLWGVSAANFDLAYADSQVTMHMNVLSLLDNVLIPMAQNAALKTSLMQARATVAMHLAAAQALRASLVSDGGAEAGTGDGGHDAAEAGGDAATSDASDAGGG
jgi:putative membrane protein